MTTADNERPSALELSSFETSWWDATLEAEHWLKMDALTPAQAALLLSGFNPHEGDLEHHRHSTVFDDLRRLHERFVAQSHVDRQHRSLADWLAFAEANDLKHSPWARRYLDMVGGKGEVPVQSEKVDLSPDQVLINKRSTWWAHTQHYIVRRMREGKYKTAIQLYQALRNEASSSDSPFETLANGGIRELVVRATSRVVSVKTIQNRWPEIRAAVAKDPER